MASDCVEIFGGGLNVPIKSFVTVNNLAAGKVLETHDQFSISHIFDSHGINAGVLKLTVTGIGREAQPGSVLLVVEGARGRDYAGGRVDVEVAVCLDVSARPVLEVVRDGVAIYVGGVDVNNLSPGRDVLVHRTRARVRDACRCVINRVDSQADRGWVASKRSAAQVATVDSSESEAIRTEV